MTRRVVTAAGGALAAVLITLTAIIGGWQDTQASQPATCGTTNVEQVRGRYTQQQIADLWTAVGGPPDQAATAGAVGMAESGGDPNATGPPTQWGRAVGLMQILGAVLPGDLRDPEVNMRNAVKKYGDAHGWTPWEAYTNGNYLKYMRTPTTTSTSTAPASSCDEELEAGLGNTVRTVEWDGGQWPVPLPGYPGVTCDPRIIPNLLALLRRYKMQPGDCYAPTGHAADGEHPLGLAVDLVPAPGGSWDLIDKAAHWAEPVQNQPRTPFRWVGYDGDPNHGRGNHLHLSWQHGPGRPASAVTVLTGG